MINDEQIEMQEIPSDHDASLALSLGGHVVQFAERPALHQYRPSEFESPNFEDDTRAASRLRPLPFRADTVNVQELGVGTKYFSCMKHYGFQ